MTRDPNGKNEQPLAKIQHSRARDHKTNPDPNGPATIVADPKNRSAGGKVDPSTRKLKPSGR